MSKATKITPDFGNTKIYTNVTFEAFTAVTMKNAFFWDIKKQQLIPHRGHITSPLQRPAG
jgi:hypothetical protein